MRYGLASMTLTCPFFAYARMRSSQVTSFESAADSGRRPMSKHGHGVMEKAGDGFAEFA
jgi:hypothetical protein